MSEDIYFKMISDKTASLISASCKLGYISTSQDEKKVNIEKFGEYLGIAYQLKDDLFDVLGKLEDTGKPSQLDLKKNMLTLPYIHILNQVPEKKKKRIISNLKYYSRKNNFKEIRSLISDYDSIIDNMFNIDFPIYSTGNSYCPAVDIHETEKEFILSADMPGLNKKDVSLDIHDGVITIKGERIKGDGKSYDSYKIHERHHLRYLNLLIFRCPHNLIHIILPK